MYYEDENRSFDNVVNKDIDVTDADIKSFCEDMKKDGIGTLYLVTDHTGFYERYGWEFFCMAQGDGEEEMTRLYIHKG